MKSIMTFLIFSVYLFIFCTGCKDNDISEKDPGNTNLPGEQPLKPIPHYVYPVELTNVSAQTLGIFDPSGFSIASKPNIYLILVSGLRKDYVNSVNTPNITAFAKDAMTPKVFFSNGTEPYLSWFSLLYSRLGHERAILAPDYMKGALNLRILKALGYKLNLYGNPESFFCHDPALRDKQLTRVAFFNNRVLFSDEPKFVKNCQIYQKQEPSITSAIDENTYNMFSSSVKNNKSPSMNMIFLDSMEREYSWKVKSISPVLPSENNMLRQPVFSAEKIKIMKNSYNNSVRYTDFLVGEIIKKLKKEKLYKNSIVALISTQGEALYDTPEAETKFKVGHGGFAFKPIMETVFYIKFPESFGKTDSVSRLSHLDVFPYIFDKLKLKKKYDYNSLITRAFSADNKKNKCEVSFFKRKKDLLVTLYNGNFRLLMKMWLNTNNRGAVFEWVELYNDKEKLVDSIATQEDKEKFLKNEFTSCLDQIGKYNKAFYLFDNH